MAKVTLGMSQRKRRHLRVRRKVSGSAERPRLSVFRSLQHIYAQVVDDIQGVTLAAASTMESEINQQASGKSKAEVADLVGQLAGRRALENGVQKVVFDRAGYKYHGRIKALADGARTAGLEF